MTWSYRPALDGLRTVAVYLVLLYHAGMAAVGGGFVGVDLFFVLSGFLVSNVILSEIDERGTLRLGRFYARRVKRLLPAAVVVITATAAVFVLATTVVRRLPLVADAQSALLYVSNWRFLSQQNDYFATEVDRSPYLHFWSLSIEEQFYFVFPILLILLVRAARRRGWVLPAGIAVLMVLSVAAQLYWASADPSHAYYGTDARLYQLLAGALLAVLLRARKVSDRQRWLGVVGLVMILVVGSGLLDVTPSNRGLLATVASVLLILGVSCDRSSPLTTVLSRPTPVFLGKISYGTYLWHWPVLLVLMEFFDVRPLVLALLGGAVSTGLAALSYQVLEMPIRRSETLSRFTWPVAVVGVTASALVAFLVMPPLLQSTRPPALVASGVAATPNGTAKGAKIPSDIDWEAVSLDYGSEQTCTTPAECVVVDGDGPHVVLVGDSHARMLEPMYEKLAEEHGFQLSVNIMHACPWQADLINFNRPPAERQECVAQRGAWYKDVLPELKPDLMILVSNSYDNEAKYAKGFKRIGGSDESLSQLLDNTTQETLATFSELGARSLVTLNTLETGGIDPLDCLARATYISQCTIPARMGSRPSDAYYQVAAVRSDDVYTVDINPVVCPDAPLCLPILKGVVVWRDPDHLTGAIGIELRDKVWKAIKKTGALQGLGFS
ncbi:acyltransferase family protein [Nocardioides sp.]|uniref:acyltransferase family protein n=1 Tax=Nocardioides sp. TaxID=35761 RepID=UPI003D0FDEA4